MQPPLVAAAVSVVVAVGNPVGYTSGFPHSSVHLAGSVPAAGAHQI